MVTGIITLIAEKMPVISQNAVFFFMKDIIGD
jgi:hypothetical protein